MKKISTFFISLFAMIFAHAQSSTTNNMQTLAQNSRSDTFDILHYTIKLNITDFVSDTIRGGTTIKYTAKIDGQTELDLDLLHMTIDSVVENNLQLTHIYTDTLLKINLPTVMNTGDTSDITIWYHGKPQMDPSGWGGFYFQSGYAYNLGVGFQTNPVNFGRAWYPCFDNFVERAPYTFIIGTNAGKIAYCNGNLGADTTDVNGIRWRTWNIIQTLPSYLACVSIANYTQVNWMHNGIYGNVPITLTALAADTTNMKNSFVHLNNALDCFENHYGQFEWPHVGYSLVPFTSGAMEHATNIAFPLLAANGTTTYEANIMAHELSHHWFGDLATCNNEGDMWLNEGWAVYSQYLFTQWVYGQTAYDNGILANHDDMVHFVDIREPLYGAVSGVPHAYTYGTHVYEKGADMVHTLRGYMGDSLFFAAIHYHLQHRQYTDVTTDNRRDDFIASSGLNYLNDFFNDWIYNSGWPQFSVDSIQSVPSGSNYNVTVYVKQKLKNAPHYFTNVPLEFSFLKSDWSKTTFREMISGEYTNFTVTLPYDPVVTAIDLNDKISDAISDEAATIKTTGAHNFAYARVNLTVVNVSDSAYIRVEHNWVTPDSIRNNPNHFRISSLRYWHIDGIFPSTFYTKARFFYDGRTTSTAGPGDYLDNDLTITNGDSIILLYRKDASEDWHEYPHYTKTVSGNHITSKFGWVDVDTLVKGEYTFACGHSSVLIGIKEVAAPATEVTAYPNPAGNDLTVEWPGATNDPILLNVYDMNGKIIFSETVTGEQAKIETQKWMDGYYIVEAIQKNKMIGQKKVMILH